MGVGSSRSIKVLIAGASFCLLASMAQASGTGISSQKPKSSVSSTQTSKKSHKRHVSRKRKPRGQQKIDASRTREIQQALIQQHYLDGEVTGNWDSRTQAALQHYQSDNGWQTKVVPDSRALIKLGLGPDHDHLLNPETAMTSSLASSKSEASAQTGSSASTADAAATHPQQ